MKGEIMGKMRLIPSTVLGLIRYFRGIPGKKWCVGLRNNGKGQHCAIGHWEKLIGKDHNEDQICGVDIWRLAEVNNGERYADGSVDPKAKSRVIKFLESLVK